MGKYEKLGEYLSNQIRDQVTLGFGDVERILGFDLPKSARIYPPWWANDRTHVQARDGWLDHGWIVETVELEKETVVFRRIRNDAAGEKRQAESAQPSSASEFEEAARRKMAEHYNTALRPGQIPNVPKLFDMVSDDKTIVGDAKYYTLVRGESPPPAKFATIAEHVWLLENLDAKEKFLVFGNDIRVPKYWLRKHGHMVKTVVFYFLDLKTSRLERLN